MATALIRIGMMIFRAFGNILRAKTLLEFANTKKKVNVILKFRDVVEYTKLDKNFKDFIKKQLFSNLETHNFIFESEEELRDYILRIDSRAKIVKILELKEIDLYIVEFSDIRLFLKMDDESIFQQFLDIGFLNQITIWLNYFLSYSLEKLREKEAFLENTLIKYVNDYVKYLENQKSQLKNDVGDIINTWKQRDIANTYCVECSCCCGCEAGSCCCSCQCQLVHYVQSWDFAKNEIFGKIDITFKNLEEEIKKKFIDKSNKESYINVMYNNLVNKENDKSYLVLFLLALEKLLFNFKEKSRNKLLFAVLKENEILKLYKKELYKTGVMREIYKFLEGIRGKKLDYNKLIIELQNYLNYKLNKKYTKHQIQILFNTAIKQYHFRKYKFKKNGKMYIMVV